MMAPSSASLKTALAAVARGDHGAARDILVAAWRARRAPAIAEMIDVLDPLAPDALSTQLAALVTPRVATTLANLKQLATVDDPRLASWALAALANPPFCAATAEPLLVLIATTIDRLRDRRLETALPAVRSILTARLTRKPVYTKVLKRLDVAVARRPVEPRATRPEQELERQLAVAIAALRKPVRTVESLLAEVYARPDDDAPRMVLADVLLERGEPRGEFIALQLARGRDGEPTERERELLKQHGKRWLGALATVLSFGKGYSATTFARGFVAHADFIFKIEKKLPLISRDPGWATVETGWVGATLFEHAPLRALREATLDDEDVEALQRRAEPLPAVTRVVARREVPIPLLRRVFPALATLEVRRLPADVAGLAALELAALELDLTRCKETRAEHDELLARLAQVDARLRQLVVRTAWSRVELRRGATGKLELASTIAVG